MSQYVKGHYRGGKWIRPYDRREKEEGKTRYLAGLFEEEAPTEAPRDSKWGKEFCPCTEGGTCCFCKQQLGIGEVEPVGMGLEKHHRLCNKCLWEY